MNKSILPRLAVPLSLGLLWYFVLRDLSLEWSANPQYEYAWAVPFLCAYLAWRELQKPDAAPGGTSGEIPAPNATTPVPLSAAAMVCLVALAIFWFPVRLIGEANPDWRVVMWAMALIAVGITVLLLGIAFPPAHLRSPPMLFAVGFFLVAVPWPGILEAPLVAALTRQNTLATVELLGLLGIPALPLGSSIQLATGKIGIDEACSGIRSLQAGLMIALFLGQLFRLRVPQRFILLGLAFALTMTFNLLRTLLLSCLAAQHGLDAADAWHDTTGVAVLVLCFFSLYGGARLLSPKTGGSRTTAAPGVWRWQNPLQGSTPCAWALILLLLISEAAVQAWYTWHERNLGPPVEWQLSLPPNLPALRHVRFAERETRLLRFDHSANLKWVEGPLRWQAVFLAWNPGRISAMAARGHTPEGCLPGSGKQLIHSGEERTLRLHGLSLRARILKFSDSSLPLHVLYCLSEDRASHRSANTHNQLTRTARISAALAGQRNLGQRSLELAVWGIQDTDEAAALLESRCRDWIKPQTTPLL